MKLKWASEAKHVPKKFNGFLEMEEYGVQMDRGNETRTFSLGDFHHLEMFLFSTFCIKKDEIGNIYKSSIDVLNLSNVASND